MFISSFRQCLLHMYTHIRRLELLRGGIVIRKNIYVRGSWKSLWGQVLGEAFGGDEHVRFEESLSLEQLSSSAAGSTYSFRYEINFSECRGPWYDLNPDEDYDERFCSLEHDKLTDYFQFTVLFSLRDPEALTGGDACEWNS